LAGSGCCRRSWCGIARPRSLAVGVRPAGLHAAVAAGDVLALTTAPETLHTDVIARPLDPARTLAFELLSRDETPSPVLGALIRVAAESVERRPTPRRVLAAVA
jgi:hypothetical protein